MYDFFTTVLNMSITAGMLALAVIVLRLFMKRVPKKYVSILWALVALRLICPISISSPLSVYNIANAGINSKGQIEFFSYNETKDAPMIEYYVPQIAGETALPEIRNYELRKINLQISPIVYVWLCGTLLMLTYALLSYIALKKRVRASKKCDNNIYICDDIVTPFILGFVKPRIYLPTGLHDEAKEHVIAHETSHIKRLDHLWKPLGFVLLSIHWFNPILWIAYILFCKDIEAACDERVIAEMDKESIVAYSEALLGCASQRRMITFCPVAFGETDVKGRIKNILNYRKPAFWIIGLALVACCVVAAFFLTNPMGKEKELSKREKYAEYLAETIEKDLTDFYHFETVDVNVTVLEDEKLRGDVTISTGNKDDNRSYNDLVVYLKNSFDECSLAVNGEEIANTYEEFYEEEQNPFRLYKELDDGTWECEGYRYKYRLEITGRMPNAALESRFVFLSNIEEIPFDRAWKAAGFSSNMDDYFRPEEAVLVEMGVLPKASGKESEKLACLVTSLPESDVVSFVCEDVTIDGLKVKMTNTSGKDMIYGRYFYVEHKENGQWKQCNVLEESQNKAFTDEGIILKTAGTLPIDWSWLYGTLEKGEYRLVLTSLTYWGDDPQTAVENPVIEFVIQ